MVWSQAAHDYVESFQRARQSGWDLPYRAPLIIRTLEEQQAELPVWRLDHLVRLTDATGIIQHACYTIPEFAHGYCTDDNARALMLTIFLEELGLDAPEVQRAALTYAAFINAAFNPERKRLRNLLSFQLT